MSEPSELIADPNTPPEVLGRLAYEYPELQPQIVVHPSVYVELLQWISSYGTPAGRAAAANRLSPTQASPPPPPGASATAALTPILAEESPAAQSAPSGALPVQAATTTVERAGAKTRRFPWATVAVILGLALAAGATWLVQHRAAQETNAELEAAVAELDAAIDATEQAEKRVEAALAGLDVELDRRSGVLVTGLEMGREAAKATAISSTVLADARKTLAAAEEPGGNESWLTEEAGRATMRLEEQVAVLDESAEKIRELTVELSKE